MKILFLFVTCLILYVYAQQENAAVDENDNIETEYLDDDEIALERAIAAKKICTYACRCGIPNINPTTNTTAPVKNRLPFAGILSATVNNVRTFLCGFALINNLYGVTTRTCVQNIDATTITASLARYSTPQFRGYNRNVTIKLHPLARVNMALLRFDRAISMNNNDIRPVCLPTPNRALAGRRGVTATWGNLNGGAISRTPRSIFTNILTNDACKLANRPNVTAFDVCASRSVTTTSCQSDNGGPLSVLNTVLVDGVLRNRYTLAGLASTGAGCAAGTTLPTIYTRVPPVLYFMYTNSTDGCFCPN